MQDVDIRTSIGIPFLLACVAVLAAGCQESTVSIERPATVPSAYEVAGTVTGVSTGRPVAGATITFPESNRAVIADSLGEFRLGGLPAGGHRCVVSSPVHLATTLTVHVGTGDDADYEHIFAKIFLLEIAGPQTIRCRSAVDGNPVAGLGLAVSGIEYSGASDGAAIEWLEDDWSAVSDSNGTAVLENLPDCPLEIRVVDLETDTRQPIGFAERGILLGEGVDRPAVLTIDAFPRSLETPDLLTSSLDVGGEFHGSTLFFVFDRPMLTDPRAVTFSYYVWNTSDFRIEWVTDRRLEITALQPIEAGYYLHLRVYAANGVGFVLDYCYLEWRLGIPGSDPQGCEETAIVPRLDTTLLRPDYDFRSIYLEWATLECASRYLILARDDYANPYWTVLSALDSDFDTGSLGTRIELPPEFDRYPGEVLQTPLAGIAVEFAVVPLGYAAEPYDPPDRYAVLRDETPPSLVGVQRHGMGNNPFVEPTDLEFLVEFSEYLADDSPPPVLEITEAGGDPDYALDPADGTWIWGPLHRFGRYIFRIPPGVDASGDLYRIVAIDPTDLTGNRFQSAQTTEWEEIPGAIDFDFEDGAEGWTVEGLGWELGTPTLGPFNVISGNNCWGTVLDAYYDNNMDISLISPPIQIPEGNPTISFYAWIYIELSDNLVLWIDDGTESRIRWAKNGPLSSWERYKLDISDYAGETVRFKFRFTSNSTYTSIGAFIDLFTVYSD